MPIQGTVPVGGSFAPTDAADSFGTHNDKWGVGGYRIVKTIADRDAIPINESNLLNLDDELASGRRKLGMMVYVSDENKFYVLTIAQATWEGYNEGQKVAALEDNNNFIEFSGGEGGGVLYGNATNDGSDIYITSTNIGTATSYTEGDSYLIKFDVNNTGNSKININSIGDARIYKIVGDALEADDIIAGKIYLITYDGANFQLVTLGGGGGTADTGDIRFSGSWIKNVDTGNIFISPQDGTTWLTLPSDTQADAGGYVQLASSDPDSAGVYITTFDGTWRNWEFKPNGTTLFPSDALNAGTNSIDIKSSNYAELWFHGENTVWQANTLSNQDAYVWVDYEGTHIQNYRGEDGNDGPIWSYQWQFKNDGILQVPGRISFGNINYQSIGVGNVSAHAGYYGISLYCSVGYELNWQEGYLAAREPNSPYDLRPIYSDSLFKYTTPVDYPTFYATFDDDTLITKGYLDDQAYLVDAPSDGSTYGRKDGAWSAVTSSSGGILHATASGTDTYTASITGVTAYADGDAYLIRFPNGNTTVPTLNINTLGAKTLYRNNDGPLIGGDIFPGGEMICVYNSTLNGFQCIGSSPNSLFAYVTNAQGATISRGQVVYAFGGTGDRIEVKLASNSGDPTSAKTVGVVYSTSIAANQKGIILMQGHIDGLGIVKPSDGWADGDSVYLGATAGSITRVKPYAPAHLVYVATVTTANNGTSGRMYVKVQNGYELEEIHDVDLITNAPAAGQFLRFDGTLWKNSASTLALSGNTSIGSSTHTVSFTTTANTTLALPASGTVISTVTNMANNPVTGTPSGSNFLRGDGTWATGVGTGSIATGTARRLAIYSSGTGLVDSLDASGFTRIVIAAHATTGREYTIPDSGAAASFVMTQGTQTIAGSKTFSSAVTISATTSQIVLGTTNTTTITSPAPAASRVYTIPDAGATASFVMTQGAQSITGIKTFVSSAGPIQFNDIINVSTPTAGATPSNGTRIVIAPGDATPNTPLSFGINTSYEFWMAGRFQLTFYPRNQTTSVAAFDYVATGNGTTGLILSSTYSTTVPALRSTGWIFAAGASGGGAVSTGTRSAGTKIVLRDNIANVGDASIGTTESGGANTTEMWFTSPSRIAFYTNNVTNNKLVITSTGVTVTSDVGFYATSPQARASAYTQTYSAVATPNTAKTHSAKTAAALTDSTGGAVGTTLAAITAPAANATTSLTTDMTNVKNALASLADQVNKLRNDNLVVANLVNSIIDDLQAYGLFQ